MSVYRTIGPLVWIYTNKFPMVIKLRPTPFDPIQPAGDVLGILVGPENVVP